MSQSHSEVDIVGGEDVSTPSGHVLTSVPVTNPPSEGLLSPAAIQRAIDSAFSQSLPGIIKVAVKAASKSHRKSGSPKRFKAMSPSSWSSPSEASSESPPRKRKRKTKHIEPRVSRRKGHRSKGNKVRSSSDSSPASSPSRSSSPDREEGELSDHEEPKAKKERLFPSDFLPTMVDSSSVCLHISHPGELESDSDPDRSEAFPAGSTKQTVFPFPKPFNNVFSQAWVSHPKGLGSSLMDKLYTLPAKQMALLKVPTVDPPVAALASSTVPVDGDVWPKDPTDRKIETYLKRNFEQSAFSFRASAANSVMSRAAFLWAQNAARMKGLPKTIKSIFKKIALASAFAADASLDSMHLAARSMASGVAARRAVWLRSWSGDSSSHAKLISLPFEGNQLFGKALDPILVESKDKRKMLPPGKKDQSRSRSASFRSFRSFRPRYRDGGSQQFKSQWTNARVLPRNKASFNKRRDARKPGRKDRGNF